MVGPALMLASPSVGEPVDVIQQLQNQGGWWFEVKFDGVRAAITRNARGGITITNRREVDITYRYPDVVERFESADFVGTIDGEIINLDANGRPDFERAHRRDAQSNLTAIRRLSLSLPATYVPFDVLSLNGRDQTHQEYAKRRVRLATVFSGDRDMWSLSAQEGEAMWEVVQSRKLEGLVAKRGTSTYVAGRSPNWLKIKSTKRVSVLVTGYTPGNGSRGAVGALEMALWDPKGAQLVPVGRVGSGFKSRDLQMIKERIGRGEHLIADVEYLEASSTQQLRMPVFKGLRFDVPIEDCTVDTLL